MTSCARLLRPSLCSHQGKKPHPGFDQPRYIQLTEISDEVEIGRGNSGVATRAVFEGQLVVVKKPVKGKANLEEQMKE